MAFLDFDEEFFRAFRVLVSELLEMISSGSWDPPQSSSVVSPNLTLFFLLPTSSIAVYEPRKFTVDS